MTHRVAIPAALAAFAILGTGCATADAEPAPAPITVATVQSVNDVTLSNGDRVHNVGFDTGTTYGDTPREQCLAAWDLAYARDMLAGRQVVDAKEYQRWDGATPGYVPAELYFADPDKRRGDDLSREWLDRNYARADACPRPEAPLSGSTATAEPGDVYVHVDGDDDGESRFCGRRWWC